jgi:hypothetical protein
MILPPLLETGQRLSFLPFSKMKTPIIPIVFRNCAFVISTEGPRSGPQWRDLAANEKQV